MPAKLSLIYAIFNASSMSPAVSLVLFECRVSFRAAVVMSLMFSSKVFLNKSTASRATIWAPTLFIRSLIGLQANALFFAIIIQTPRVLGFLSDLFMIPCTTKTSM